MSARDPREERLPKWAQAEMERLRLRAMRAEAERDEARLATGPDESDVVIDGWGAIPVGLGRGTQISFRPPGPTKLHPVRRTIDVRVLDNGTVQVLGGAPLIVRLGASNVLYLTLDD